MSKPVDTTRWPVVVVLIDETLAVDEATTVTDELAEILGRNERMGLVFDYQRGIPEVQQMISMWLARQAEALGRLVAGAVTVVPPDRVEHMQSIIGGGMFSMPFPSWAEGSIDDGVSWVQAQLAADDA